MTSIADGAVHIQTSPDSVPSIPSWFGEVALMAAHLRKHSVDTETDMIDAYLLAKTGRADFQDLRRLNPDSEQIQKLKTLTRDQDAMDYQNCSA